MGLLLDSFWTELLLAGGALCFYFYLWVRQRFRYFQERGIPYLKPTFFFTDMWRGMVGKERLADSFTRCYERLRGHKMGGTFQLFKPVLILRDPSLINQVLVKDFRSFHSHGFEIDEKTNPLEGHLFNLEGEKWRAMRKKLSPTFTSGKLKWMFPQMESCGRSLVGMAQAEAKAEGGDVDVKDLFARFTTDVIGSCAFGYEPEAIKDPNCKFRVMGKKFFNFSSIMILKFVLRFCFPRAFNLLKLKTVDSEVESFFFSVVSQSFEHRVKTGESRNDFIQLLLELKQKGKIDFDPRDRAEEVEEPEVGPLGEETEALEMTDELLTAQVFVFFGAGFDTAGSAISSALYLIGKNPSAQERAREEVRRLKAEHGGRITYEALKGMAYLDACVQESLRMMAPIDILFRRCSRETYLDGKLVDKGVMVMIPTKSIHNDQEFFPEPDLFRPERFMGGQEIVPGSYLPFGDGPRLCIARRFALVEMKLGLALLLDEFRLRPSPRTPEPLATEPRTFTLQAKGGLWVGLERLEH